MDKDRSRDLAESLRISPMPVILLLAVPAVVMSMGAFSLPHPHQALILALCTYATVLLLLGCNALRPTYAPYATLCAYLAVIAAGALVTEMPSLWILCCAVTVLAAALAGNRVAIYTGILVAAIYAGLGLASVLDWRLAAPTIVLDLGLVATLAALLQPVYTLAYWSYERYDRAQVLLDEARNRQAELKQTIDALAHANRELALAHDRIVALRQVAEDARRTKSTFVSNVSHEFRAPLNIIIGLAEILLDAEQVYGQPLPPEAREDIAILYRNCQHLHDLVNDVLDLSQIESGQLALRREWVDLSDILASAAEIVRPLASTKGLSLELQVSPGLYAYCDPRRIRQVILNLVSNAARFTEHGGIVIDAHQEGDEILVSVQDTGPGIALDDVERIFEPFQQSATAGAVLGKGSGLGLAISREFVRMHDGQIWVETKPGEGSTFAFRLPVQPGAGPIVPAERWITSAWYDHVRTTQVPTETLGDRVIVCDTTGRLAGVIERYAGDMEPVLVPSRQQVASACQDLTARAVLLCANGAEELLGDMQTLGGTLPGTPIVGIVLPATPPQEDLGGALAYNTKPVSIDSLVKVFANHPTAPHRVRVVDDEADSRHVLSALLQHLDPACEIREAFSGEQALSVLATWRPDLILLDVVMPRMDGWQTLATLQGDRQLSAIPAIMISAQDRYLQPLTGTVLLASIQGGMNLGKLLAAFRALNEILLPHSGAPAAAHRGTPPE
ncbi:MAG: hybrid sensor histidine kinase/response regulator [Anaerolineales bacterium]